MRRPRRSTRRVPGPGRTGTQTDRGGRPGAGSGPPAVGPRAVARASTVRFRVRGVRAAVHPSSPRPPPRRDRSARLRRTGCRKTTEVLPLLDAAIREDPLRERSRELLMLALYRSGRHAEALGRTSDCASCCPRSSGWTLATAAAHAGTRAPPRPDAPARGGSRRRGRGRRPQPVQGAATVRRGRRGGLLRARRPERPWSTACAPAPGSSRSWVRRGREVSVLAAGVVPRLAGTARSRVPMDGSSRRPARMPARWRTSRRWSAKATELPVGLADLLDGRAATPGDAADHAPRRAARHGDGPVRGAVHGHRGSVRRPVPPGARGRGIAGRAGRSPCS